MKMNKKGFTLVELLAVIVILAVVMLIGVTAVGPLMTKARKSTLGDEGLGLITVAQTAYQAEQLGGGIKPVDSVCFDLAWLKSQGYYQKDDSQYSGSVLVHYNTGGTYNYYFWITNNSYAYTGISAEVFNKYGEETAHDYAATTDTNMSSCGTAFGTNSTATVSYYTADTTKTTYTKNTTATTVNNVLIKK